MQIRLHKQATTTPKVRAAIQASDEPAWVLALLIPLDGLLAVIREFLTQTSHGLVWTVACGDMASATCVISR